MIANHQGPTDIISVAALAQGSHVLARPSHGLARPAHGLASSSTLTGYMDLLSLPCRWLGLASRFFSSASTAASSNLVHTQAKEIRVFHALTVALAR